MSMQNGFIHTATIIPVVHAISNRTLQVKNDETIEIQGIPCRISSDEETIKFPADTAVKIGDVVRNQDNGTEYTVRKVMVRSGKVNHHVTCEVEKKVMKIGAS